MASIQVSVSLRVGGPTGWPANVIGWILNSSSRRLAAGTGVRLAHGTTTGPPMTSWSLSHVSLSGWVRWPG